MKFATVKETLLRQVKKLLNFTEIKMGVQRNVHDYYIL